MSRRDFIATVGYGVPIRRRVDGTLLIGTRRFTPSELVEYMRNMYGNSYYRRLQMKTAKKYGHDWCSARAHKGWDTKRAIYGEGIGSAIRSKGFATLKRSPAYAEYVKKVTAHLRTPEAIAKSAATRSRRRYEIEWRKQNSHRYFICDAEIDGREYHEGEWLCPSDQDYDKANEMMLLEVYCGCLPETKHQIQIHRSQLYHRRQSLRRWLSRRPDIIAWITSLIATNKEERRRNGQVN